jgi:RND family efflux transporter MFP subunit
MPMFTVEDVRGYRLEVAVNETDLSSLRIGQTVPVLVDALGNSELQGKVVQIVPAADPGSRSFLIKVDLPAEPRLRSGLFGRAQFSRGERQSLLVPRTAIVERGQLQGVFVLDQNQVAALRYVTLGRPTQNDIEVLAGLQEGDRLVAKPGSLELDGKRIEAQP